MFLDIKVVTEKQQLRFWTLSTNKEGRVYVFSIQKPQNKQYKRATVVRKLKAKYEWCFSRLKCNKIGAVLQLQVKLQKTAKITYIEANIQRTAYRLTYLDLWKIEEKYDWYFEGQRTAWKINVTFLPVIKIKIRCFLSIWRAKSGRMAILDAF